MSAITTTSKDIRLTVSPPFPSSNSTERKVLSLTKRYRTRGFPNFGRVKIDGEARNTFRF
ncbi:hypothetical protein MtrunA17_Chr3g0130041 [Medicago truncatula]|uniref:Uncharacterized protein n=1 Tax=Medicago truncatula TaxID=3880 RepID=A0A396IZP6_MEDTR|nr:hypothetical protein MtrunA17_Chr3g0130041 [Medicago truncatula]